MNGPGRETLWGKEEMSSSQLSRRGYILTYSILLKGEFLSALCSQHRGLKYGAKYVKCIQVWLQ